MASSTNVTLPTKIVPLFPQNCVVCTERANSTAKITQHSQNPLAVFFAPFLFLFGWSRIEFPICSSCKPRFYVERWGRMAICWTIVVLACIFVGPFFNNWDPTTRKVALAVACVLVAAPYILYEIVFPRSFDTTSYPNKTTYEFKSQQLALQFYAINREKYPHAIITIDD